MNCFAKTVKARATELEDYVQMLVHVNLVVIGTACVLRRLRNDTRRQVPSEYLNVYKKEVPIQQFFPNFCSQH